MSYPQATYDAVIEAFRLYSGSGQLAEDIKLAVSEQISNFIASGQMAESIKEAIKEQFKGPKYITLPVHGNPPMGEPGIGKLLYNGIYNTIDDCFVPGAQFEGILTARKVVNEMNGVKE